MRLDHVFAVMAGDVVSVDYIENPQMSFAICNSVLTGEYCFVDPCSCSLVTLVYVAKQGQAISHTDLLHAHFHELPLDH